MNTGDLELKRTFYLLGCLTLVGAFLYWAAPFMIPVTIAILATFVLSPLVARVERWGVKRFFAGTMVVLGAAVLAAGIAHIFVLQLSSLSSEFPAFKSQLSDKLRDVREATANSWVADLVDLANELGKPLSGGHSGNQPIDEPVVARMEFPLVSVLQSAFGTFAQIAISAVLVLILTILMLHRREDLRNRMIFLLGAQRLVTATRALDDASKRISKFLYSQLIINVGFGVVVTLGLLVIGIPYAYVWGALAALLRYLPYLGGWIAAAFPLLASLVMPDWTPFLLTGAFFITAELLQAYLVEPLVFGHSIGVTGVGQLIAALFWACLWGPVGLILSTPLTACLCVLGRHFTILRFFATLMGEEEGVQTSAAFYQRLVAGDADEASDLVENFLKESPPEEVVDSLLIPALLSGQHDFQNGELTVEDQTSITETVREIFDDVVAPFEREHRLEAEGDDHRSTRVVVLKCPFNNEIDDLIADMLRDIAAAEVKSWATETLKNNRVAAAPPADDGESSVILLATSARKNLPRVRAACRMIRKLRPDATIVIGCWGLEDEIDAIRARFKAAGATRIFTTALEARHFIEEDTRRELPATQLAT